MSGTLVGRPKKQTKPGQLTKTVGVRATSEWAEWLERLAKHCRTDIAKLIDASVAEYGKAHGFDEPPPERIP